MAYYPVPRDVEYSMTVTYWLGSAFKPPFSDAHTPLTYKLGSFRGEETFKYKTIRGYKRHVAMIRNAIKENGRIVRVYDILVGDENPKWKTHIVYYPNWTRGPHAAPHVAVIPACEID